LSYYFFQHLLPGTLYFSPNALSTFHDLLGAMFLSDTKLLLFFELLLVWLLWFIPNLYWLWGFTWGGAFVLYQTFQCG